MATEERLAKVEREVAETKAQAERAKRHNRWLPVMASLATAVVLAGPLAEEGLGQLSRTTRNLPWWEKLLVEAGVFGAISIGLLGVGAVALLVERIRRRGTDNTRQDLKERGKDDHERAS